MASQQDRFQMNRALLDDWSTRELLCLASAVSHSGDQNWVSVSRSLKILCGNNNNGGVGRPADWFSPKSCALQYAHLLENVETPKRKKRSNEGNLRISSPASIVETPTDSVLRRLTKERIEELQTEIRKGQEEYVKIHTDLQKIQSPNLTEETLLEMWREIEQEQEADRIAEMKLENQLREREQRRQDLNRNWSLSSTVVTATSKQENIAVVDMDLEEIVGVSKPIIPAQQQTATSPLLTSLLKLPTATAAPILCNVASSVRATAPTITTLLTSGSIPNTNQPAIILNSDLIPPEKAVQLLTRPISGPPVGDTLSVSNTVAQNLLSPSQSAPTLSMLLEKNKTAPNLAIAHQSVSSTTVELNSNTPAIKTSDSNKEAKQMDIEKDTTDQSSKAANEADSDETDPNEEQQLMEVFKNIGNIELDIDVSAVIDDEEVDFLKGVDEESPRTGTGTVEPTDFENKLEEASELTANSTQARLDVKYEEKSDEADLDNVESKTGKTEIDNVEQKEIKIEISSDDSNDNLPLAAVATLENKERNLLNSTKDSKESKEKFIDKTFLKAKVESAKTNVESAQQNQLDKSATSEAIDIVKEEASESSKIEQIDKQQINSEEAEKLISKTDASEDIFEDTTDELEQESNQEKDIEDEVAELEAERYATPTGENELDTAVNILIGEEDSKSDAPRADDENAIDNSTTDATLPSDEPTNSTASQIEEYTSTSDSVNAASLPTLPSSHISVADTDEDSSTTDISIITHTAKREHNPRTSSSSLGSKQKTERASSQSRKSNSHATSFKSTEDSDSSSGNRASKRSLLSILNGLACTKSAQTIQHALNDEHFKSKYQKICYRHLDLQTIKKRIESGAICSVVDLQRDLLQLTQNVTLLFHPSSANYKAVENFKHKTQNVREFIFNANDFEVQPEKEVKEVKQTVSKQGRTGCRKSLRIS